MYPLTKQFTLLSLVILLIVGCDYPSGEGENTSLSQLATRNSQLSSPRIVSLSPNYTEIVYSLGGEEFLVGRTDACDYPPEAKSKTVVGKYGIPNWEKLYCVRPTVILTADFVDDRAQKLLQDRGIDVYRNNPQTFDDLFTAILETGKRIHRESEAKKLIEDMKSELTQIQTRVAQKKTQSPRVLVVVGVNPLCVAGSQTFIHQAIQTAGGINVADDLTQPYVNISPEKVVKYAPDVIVYPLMSSGTSTDALFHYPGWESVPAIRNRRIITDIPADLLLRPGPRLTQGIKLLEKKLY